jgi:hypothetical protein
MTDAPMQRKEEMTVNHDQAGADGVAASERGFKDGVFVGGGEIERLRKALRDVMNAENCPYEVARLALDGTAPGQPWPPMS